MRLAEQGRSREKEEETTKEHGRTIAIAHGVFRPPQTKRGRQKTGCNDGSDLWHASNHAQLARGNSARDNPPQACGGARWTKSIGLPWCQRSQQTGVCHEGMGSPCKHQ
eukprot:88133-Rhodomonas_salina.1